MRIPQDNNIHKQTGNFELSVRLWRTFKRDGRTDPGCSGLKSAADWTSSTTRERLTCTDSEHAVQDYRCINFNIYSRLSSDREDFNN